MLKIWFKTRGGHQEGMGDITSSLAMADEMKRCNVGEIGFIINNQARVIQLIIERGYRVIDENDFYTDPDVYGKADIIIVNQLDTPPEEMRILKRCSRMLAAIDDTGAGADLADLCFNVLYPIAGSISDFSYIPLSPVYQEKHNVMKTIKDRVDNVLVLQGGSDTYGFTPKIVKALGFLPDDITVNVVLGPNFQHQTELQIVLAELSRKVNLLTGLTDLSEVMQEADLAISAGGITLFELACLGVPTIVVCAEEFEAITARRVEKSGFGVNLGFGRDLTSEQIQTAATKLINDQEMRAKLSRRSTEIIDGRGTPRMVETIFYRFSANTEGQ